MRNHKQFKFWDNLILLLVRSYRFASTLPANDQYALGAEIKRLTVRCRMPVVDVGACEAALDCARSLELAYRQVKELGSCIEFAAELGLTKLELVDELIQSGDRMAGAIFSYRRSLLE